ncbi:hypothetical protein CJ010_01755 [Azoarcus sp. DD4]|uniref:hypothetical protein n=1 Tax=Azoarcus sp. DD4 TaxID=2027405 RepID=UPI00112D1D6C|nr:hypothetical protein [Azoarcus sp. DD4]QDF95365.1 hypothetical protein CJ010_01755 [Azoarcus sp. DD4]
MSKITFQEAPLQMARGVVGIGEHHDNHWGRMLVLTLLQCEGARHLLIESAADQQYRVDGITTDAGAIDSEMARALDGVSWQTEGVLPLSIVIYQAQKRGVQVTCADDMCVYSAEYAVRANGMKKRNQTAVNTLLGLGDTPPKGVIMLNGADHFKGSNTKFTIGKLLEGQEGLSFGWVDASTKEGSGFGVRVG